MICVAPARSLTYLSVAPTKQPLNRWVMVGLTQPLRLMLTVLGGLAEFERHLILARTNEGRQRAQQRAVRFGRKPKLTLHQQQEALARRAAGEALVDIARSYAVNHSTISRLEATI
jgi:DNA invertase Pin-like site-specific DNA recombinase